MKNVCIVGWGAIAPLHAYAINDTKNAKFYAVCDIIPEKISKCKKDFGVSVTYTDFDEMLKDKDIDSVHICTPHHLHCDMIQKALASGKKVVCEKPVAITKDEFLSLADKDFCVIMQNRTNPCIKKIKEIADSKKYGELITAKAFLTWCRTKEYYESADWRGKISTEGGGVLINQAVHTLDFMSYLTGGIKKVSADIMNYSLKNEIETEDTVVTHLTFCNDKSGIFFATNAYSKDSSPMLEIEFEKAHIRYIDKKLFIDGNEIMSDDSPSPGKECWGGGHQEQIKNFYDENSYFSVKDIENTMLSLYAIYRSAKIRKEVIV